MKTQPCTTTSEDTDTSKLAAISAVADETRPAVTPADGDRGFLTTRELQKTVLPLSRRSIFEWRKKGILPSIQVGSKIFWHRESVIAALLRRQHGGGQ
jgi:hypothetical protein